MSIWVLLQIVVNIFLMSGVSLCLFRIFKEKEDDPRLTHGLRLLQSKISILEDLSDHTENQVKQLMILLDKKLQEVRSTMTHMNQQIGEVDRSIEKTRLMAEKIQNEMTQENFIEKKLENRYIQAAQMAHQGHGVDEIVQKLNLPKAEVELIAKINKKKCLYEKPSESFQEKIFAESLEMPAMHVGSGVETEIGFRQAVQEHSDKIAFKTIKLG